MRGDSSHGSHCVTNPSTISPAAISVARERSHPNATSVSADNDSHQMAGLPSAKTCAAEPSPKRCTEYQTGLNNQGQVQPGDDQSWQAARFEWYVQIWRWSSTHWV